jgi:hypothetical protein
MPATTQPIANISEPTNVYYVIDDYGNTAPSGPGAQSNTAGSGGTGAPLTPEFTAPSATAAITMAHLIASVLQRSPVRIVQKLGGSPPWTLVQGAPANVALTSVPSGISY